MARSRVLIVGLTLPFLAQAAEISRIESSFDPDHPFGASLDVGFERTQQKSRIVREAHQNGSVQDVNEMDYLMQEDRLKIDARIGLWQDLELHFGLPIVFNQDRSWGYAGGTTNANSTIHNNCLQANGQLTDPNCSVTGAGAQPMFGVPNNSYRAGIGDFTIGLAYAIFNTKRDDTKPMWIVGLDYTAPTATGIDPTQATTSSNRGPIGFKVHEYNFYTILSKRVGVADPYFKLWYQLPFKGPGWYSNCDHPSVTNMGAPQNCNTNSWSRSDTGINPPHTGGFEFGSEFNAFDDPSKHQKVAIDFRGIATYVSEGRYYNELSDLFGKYMDTADYFQLGGRVGLIAHLAEYVALGASATLLYETEHTLTNESIGKDLNGNGVVDVTTNPVEINPNFDWRTDMVSRRFRLNETAIFTVNATATFSF